MSLLVNELAGDRRAERCQRQPLLECAEAAKIHFLVTGNTKHFPPQWMTTRRVTARELLEIIGPKLLEGRH